MIKQALQHFIVKTDVGPMAWGYRACYAFALSIIVEVLKKQPDIIAVYLISGMVTNGCVAGLSDIDLMIVVKDTQGAKEKVHQCCIGISRWIPIFKDDEQSLYDIEEIKNCHARDDFYLKYKLYVEYKDRGKLLCGTDVLRDLKGLDASQRNECVIGQMTFLWSVFLNNFLMKNRVTDALTKNYFCYKLTADACRAYIFARETQVIFDRKKALADAQSLFGPQHRAHLTTISELGQWRFAGSQSGVVEDTCDFCMDIIQDAVGLIPAIPEPDEEQEAFDNKNFDFESFDFILSDVNKCGIDAFVDLVKERHSQDITSVLVSPMDLLHIKEHMIGVFITLKKNISFNVIKEFTEALKSSQPCPQHLYLYLVTPQTAFCLKGGIYPAFFPLRQLSSTLLYLSTPAAVRWGKPLHYQTGRKIVRDYFWHDFKGSISREIILVGRAINDQHILRESNVDFHLFFWEAIRLKLVEASIDAGKTFIPLSSAQVVRRCRQVEGFNAPWLEEFHGQFKKDLNGFSSDSEFYFSKGMAFLKEIYAEDFSHHYHIQ